MTSRAETIHAVTGAGGHLGVNLVLQLLEAGHTVRALYHRRSVPPLLERRERLSHHRVDVLSPESLAGALSGVRGVFHLAGKISLLGDPDGSVWKTNVEGSKNVALACLRAGVERLVHCSSVQALEILSSTASLDETLQLTDVRGRRPAYDRSKAASMVEVEALGGRGLSVVSVLPTGVIGPHDFAPSSMGRVFVALRNRSLPALTHGAFDFVDVRDVALGMMRAMERPVPSVRYVLGGHFISIARLARMAADYVGVRAPRFAAPLSVARWSAPLALAWSKIRNQEPLYTPESIQTLRLGRPTDTSLAARELDYRPRPLPETIRDIYASLDDPAATIL